MRDILKLLSLSAIFYCKRSKGRGQGSKVFFSIPCYPTSERSIIGGGINGAGVARDAALRGLKTILIEKNDFASGSSSWSTRLVHGGLRYLEYFELPLVRESLKEREILLNIAPHLVKPLLLTVPVYGDRSRPYWKIWAGMILYDLFSFDKTLPGYRMLNKAKFKRIFPTLDQFPIVRKLRSFFDCLLLLV